MQEKWKLVLAGSLAGLVNGLFGAGGGMILIPLLTLMGTNDSEIFPTSVSIIFPICFVSLLFSALAAPLPFQNAFPYLIGGAIGGFLVTKYSNPISLLWLHRILGILILYGGVRYLW
jgi:uncharacterized membrane protein YfcA